MAAFLERLAAADRKLLWLDYTDYAGALLAGGAVPWLDLSACLAWQRKAQSLLRSDVIAVPAAAICDAWLAAHPEDRAAMGEKQRVTYPLRTLVANVTLRAHLLELVCAVRASFADRTLVLACPSPRLWVGEAYGQAFGADAHVVVEEDEADSAAVYIADFLRSFGDAGVDALLLEESTQSEPASAAGLACYQPVLNVAAHYRWDVGLSVPGARYAGGEGGLAFVIAPHPLPGAHAGAVVPAAFWKGESPPDCPAGGFRYCRIPVDAAPECVLDRLALLEVKQ